MLWEIMSDIGQHTHTHTHSNPVIDRPDDSVCVYRARYPHKEQTWKINSLSRCRNQMSVNKWNFTDENQKHRRKSNFSHTNRAIELWCWPTRFALSVPGRPWRPWCWWPSCHRFVRLCTHGTHLNFIPSRVDKNATIAHPRISRKSSCPSSLRRQRVSHTTDSWWSQRWVSLSWRFSASGRSLWRLGHLWLQTDSNRHNEWQLSIWSTFVVVADLSSESHHLSVYHDNLYDVFREQFVYLWFNDTILGPQYPSDRRWLYSVFIHTHYLIRSSIDRQFG